MSEPTSAERLAYEVVRRVLGVEVEHYDTAGRQGVVDALLRFADGRVGALEVTSYSDQAQRELGARLAADDHSWPNPGAWWWTINVGDPDDINRLRTIYARVINLCEAHSAVEPADLGWELATEDPDLRWLLQSSCDMQGHPDVPSRTRDRVRSVMVVPASSGGGVDEQLIGLQEALTDAFLTPTLTKRIAKLSRTAADQRHLFLILPELGALPFSVGYGLSFGTALPPDPPPSGFTPSHLWLAPTYSERVLLWDSKSWSAHYPYDN